MEDAWRDSDSDSVSESESESDSGARQVEKWNALEFELEVHFEVELEVHCEVEFEVELEVGFLVSALRRGAGRGQRDHTVAASQGDTSVERHLQCNATQRDATRRDARHSWR